MFRQTTLTAFLLSCVSPAAVIAQDGPGGLSVYAGAELEFTNPDDGSTQELSGYVEAESNGFYGGIWAQIAKDDTANEIDLYLGYRSELASGFSYDLSYNRYYYPNDGGDCCGELILVLGQPISDAFSVSAELAVDPQSSLGSAYLGAEYAVNETLSVSANYGVYDIGPDASSQREWDLGVGYALGEETAVDLRYYDGSDYDSYFGLSLTWDTTLFGG
jgi:uncharacterized protein (TIGR02001 family)